MLTKKYHCVKEYFLQSKTWLMNHPKQVYTYVMILLTTSFGLIFLQYFYFTPRIFVTQTIPALYSQSDEARAHIEEDERKMGRIVKELQHLKMKREDGPLLKNDSIRIEYLFNQYQALKNGTQ